jgi:hypothetical protein
MRLRRETEVPAPYHTNANVLCNTHVVDRTFPFRRFTVGVGGLREGALTTVRRHQKNPEEI